ncbi:CASP-like protein [Raphanus sativus]|nr:CASP-like protein [Raphanus sativus]
MLGCSVPGDGSYHSSIVVGFFPGGGAFPRSTAAGFSCREGEASSDPPSSVFVYGVRRLAKLRAAVLEPGFFWVVVSKVMCVKCRWGFRCKGVASGHCGGALEMRMLSGDGVDLQDRKKAAVLFGGSWLDELRRNEDRDGGVPATSRGDDGQVESVATRGVLTVKIFTRVLAP